MVIDKQDRSKLAEGRSYGVGFGYLKKLSAKKYETVTPVSACEDYLNDVIYSEVLNVPIKAYGLDYKKHDIFDGKKGYLAMRFLPHQRNFSYNAKSYEDQFKKDSEKFEANIENIQALINYVEDRLGVPRSLITKDGDTYIIEGDHYWHASTYLISLYTLIIRMGFYYDGKKSPDKFLNNPGSCPDMYTWNTVKVKLYLMFQGHKITQKFNKSTGSGIHGRGILAYDDFQLF